MNADPDPQPCHKGGIVWFDDLLVGSNLVLKFL